MQGVVTIAMITMIVLDDDAYAITDVHVEDEDSECAFPVYK